MAKKEIDMLHGPLVSKILLFALPIAASSILEQIFVSIDVAVVGHFASSEALAAVGANTFLINLLLNLFIGLTIGTNVIIANYIGQRDDQGIERSVGTSMVLAVVSGVTILLLGVLLSQYALELMGTPPDVLPQAVLYLRIFCLGIPFIMLYSFGSAILRSRGDTRSPLYFLLGAGLINTVLNLVFVICFHMSVAGVAIATTIANAFSAFMVVRKLRLEDGAFALVWERMQLHRSELVRILKIGIPAGIQGMVFSLSNIFVQWGINGYGAKAIAGAAVAQNFEAYCYFIMMGFCAAAVTFTGQCYGAGMVARCRRIFKICMFFGWLSIFAANMLIWWQSDFFLGLFTTDPEVIRFALERMGITLLLQSMAVSYEMPAAGMRGLGQSLTPALLTVVGTCVLRLVWVFFIYPQHPDFMFLMYVYPTTWVVTGLLVGVAYVRVSRRAWRLMEEKMS